ncbi:MAG: proline dehydrogenase family protein [Anaerolineae bacterium]
MSLTRTFFLALSRSERLQQMALGFGPARSLARRFTAGDTLEEAIAAVQELNRQGLLATLDHLGESVTSETEARDATTAILDLLDAIEAGGIQPGISVKLTQLGLEVDAALAAENLQRIVARASDAWRFVRIDMENAEYVQQTLDLFEALWAQYRNVGVVIQSYLRRSAGDVARLVHLGASVRLVKGAYDESPDVAFANSAEIDASFNQLMEQLFSDEAQANGVFPAIATHDANLIDRTKAYADRRSVARDSFEFQMLLGVRSRLQHQLVADGYRVRAYVPYGEQWYPYLMRRLAERPATAYLLLRNLIRS